ncbi:MAG: hypothetical protein AB4062_05720 [Crocosphaera sp.]
MSQIRENTNEKIFSVNFIVIAMCFAIALLGFGYVLVKLPEITAEQIYIYQEGTCITGGWRYGLIVTHILTFILIPLAMRIFYQALNNLKLPLKTIFHILHDFGGTQAGVAIFTWIVYEQGILKYRKQIEN